eukprot:GHVU01211986.1.p1 GENE.GHVU01211986.1~~GHVU01211986.1.p1  ORF type:complete len:133 (-),score=6.61 GHVU01211986.1:299-697(-)
MSLSPPPTDEFHLGPPERDLAILHSGGPNKESLLGGSPQRGGSLRRPLPLQNNLYLASYGRGLERKFLFNVGFAYGSAMIFGSAYGVGLFYTPRLGPSCPGPEAPPARTSPTPHSPAPPRGLSIASGTPSPS